MLKMSVALTTFFMGLSLFAAEAQAEAQAEAKMVHWYEKPHDSVSGKSVTAAGQLVSARLAGDKVHVRMTFANKSEEFLSLGGWMSDIQSVLIILKSNNDAVLGDVIVRFEDKSEASYPAKCVQGPSQMGADLREFVCSVYGYDKFLFNIH